MRQDVLEGSRVKELIFELIDDAVQDAVHTYLDKKYVSKCIAEWVREKVNVSIDPERIRGKDREDLHRLVMVDGKEEAGTVIRVTIGEYLTEAIDLGTGTTAGEDPEQWDYKGLVDWANTVYKANVTVPQIRDMSRDEIVATLSTAAEKMIDEVDLSPLDQFLVPDYGAVELAKWATNKFATEFKAEQFTAFEDPSAAEAWLMDQARESYRKRELRYPIEFALDMTAAGLQRDPQHAIQQFCAWVKARFELEWTPNTLPSNRPDELAKILIEEAATWDEERFADRAERAVVAAGSSPEQLDRWFQENCFMRLTEAERKRAEDDPQAAAAEKFASIMRSELTQFERWVLLQILDQAWKDHLYAMDQLKESIGLRSFSQRDPRIEYKREGARLFEEMHMSIRDKVSDLIFKAKLTPQAPPAPPPPAATAAGQRAPQPAQPAYAAAAAAAAQAGTAQQRQDLAAATAATRGEPIKRKKQPIRAMPTVGRNEPCPCGSGKKYKQCCGQRR